MRPGKENNQENELDYAGLVEYVKILPSSLWNPYIYQIKYRDERNSFNYRGNYSRYKSR